MSPIKVLAIVLIVAGIFALAYGGFTYTKATHNANIGPFSMSIKDKETVNIPIWVGAGAIVAGALLFFVRQKNL